MRFRVVVGTAIEWHVALGTSLRTQLLNTIAGVIADRVWQVPAVLRVMGVAAKATLGTGRLNLTGLTPNGHRFNHNPRRLWLIESSHAVVDGVSVGPTGPLANQASVGDLLLPQRGLFAVARMRLEQPPQSRGTRASPAASRRASGQLPVCCPGTSLDKRLLRRAAQKAQRESGRARRQAIDMRGHAGQTRSLRYDGWALGDFERRAETTP